MTTHAKPPAEQGGDEQTHTAADERRIAPGGGGAIERLRAALEAALTLDGLNQMMVTGLDGDLSLHLDGIVAAHGRNRRDICHDLVLWALRNESVGLHGLLASRSAWTVMGVLWTTSLSNASGARSSTSISTGMTIGLSPNAWLILHQLRCTAGPDILAVASCHSALQTRRRTT